MAERELFGTDGVRGAVGDVITADLALRLGRAATLECAASTNVERPQVLVIRDTRESGPMLESALAAGIASAGGDAMIGGVLPSPPPRSWPGASTSTSPPSSRPRTTPTPTTASSSSSARA